MPAMNGLARIRSVIGWTALGLAGSLVIAVAGPLAVADPHSPWWYTPALPGGHGAAVAFVYVGVALLGGAWLGLGRHAAGDKTGWLLVIAAAWLLPLALGPALFSRDVYSYIAQGTVLHMGANPYHTPPDALATGGHEHVLAAVSYFWRHTTAPYGPLFLGVMSAIVTVTGSHLTAGVLVTRAVELAGVALLAGSVPKLARALGADPGRAVWLAVLNPLLALELVAAAHNDVLMIALLAAGVTAALRGRPWLGIAICALAATFKLPALAAALFIAVAWAREEPTVRARARFLAVSVLAAAAVLAVVSGVTGLGFTWLSSTLFSTPAKVRLAITPSTGVGYTVAALLHAAGVAVNARSVEAALGVVTLALTAGLGLILLYRVRIGRLALYVGVLLIAAAGGGPAAWPWYFTWGLVLLAACPGPQRSLALAGGSVVAVFLIKPNGILALPLPSAPAVLTVYGLLAGLLWLSRRRRRGSGLTAPTPSALAGT